MQAQSLQRSKAHRFFQSIHSIPVLGETITLERFNSKIIQQSSNLYSLFDLIVLAKSNQLSSDRPLVFFRRLMMLIYCINQEYQLYFSKIKALTNFWLEAALNAKQFISDMGTKLIGKLEHRQKFKYEMITEQFIWYTLRCFNAIFLKHTIDSSGSPIELNMNLSQSMAIKLQAVKITAFYKQLIYSYKYQSQHKILLSFQYSKFLLLNFSLLKNVCQIQNLFSQFINSLISIIRLLKKFYMLSFLEYRNLLNQLIMSALKIFKSEIPLHKINMLSSIVNYMNRKDPKFRQISLKPLVSESKGFIIKSLIKVINAWKDYQTTQQMNLSCLKLQLDPLKQRDSAIPSLLKNLFEKTLIFKQKNLTTHRKLINLKRKRCISMKINKICHEHSPEQSFVEIKRNLSTALKDVKNTRNRIMSANNYIKTVVKQQVFLKQSVMQAARKKIEQKKINQQLKPLRIVLRR